MIWHLILKPIWRLLEAIIGPERLDRWYESSIVPVVVIMTIATIAVTAYALIAGST